jgi:hypothetical protein
MGFTVIRGGDVEAVGSLAEARESAASVLGRERATALVSEKGAVVPLGNGAALVVRPSACDECSEEYGPCEEHGEVLVQREGASLRTGSESTVVQVEDCVGLGVELSAGERELLAEAKRALSGSERWIDDTDLAEALSETARDVAARLPEGVAMWSDDGYRIVRMREHCPLMD